MIDRIVALLARIPADRASVDWIALALAVLGAVLLAFGVVTPAQIPGLVELVLAVATAAGLRGAALAAKGSAVAGASAIARAVADVRAGKPTSAELVALAAALVEASRRQQPPAGLEVVR